MVLAAGTLKALGFRDKGLGLRDEGLGFMDDYPQPKPGNPRP